MNETFFELEIDIPEEYIQILNELILILVQVLFLNIVMTDVNDLLFMYPLAFLFSKLIAKYILKIKSKTN